MEEAPHAPTGQIPPAEPRRAAVIFIFITVVLDMLAVGMIVPVLPKLVVNFPGGDVARAAGVYGLFGTVWALMQFIFSPVLGALSDRFGRRPVILLSKFRSRSRLHSHGAGADHGLAVSGPRHFRHHGRQLSDRRRIHRRCDPAGESRLVGPSEQGQLQGANSSLRGISGMIGPGIFTLTFAAFICAPAKWQVPGAPFYLAGVLLIAAFALAWRVTNARSGSSTDDGTM